MTFEGQKCLFPCLFAKLTMSLSVTKATKSASSPEIFGGR
jgi:hypothetical protein